jgi:uncharacterized LabA/DUF88 family protein
MPEEAEPVTIECVPRAEPMGRRARVAVLIDAENISHRLADGLFDDINGLGEVVVRRAYADFANRALNWESASARHLITAAHHAPARKGKNSTDIALAIDAMDLLLGGHAGKPIDIFCLVSSDGDFTRLATRIREQGRIVVGFGTTASVGFREACSQYCEIRATKPMPIAAAPKTLGDDPVPAIEAAVVASTLASGWADLATVGQNLLKAHPSFKPSAYGHKKLKNLVANLTRFDVVIPEPGMDGAILVRIADENGQTSATEPGS